MDGPRGAVGALRGQGHGDFGELWLFFMPASMLAPAEGVADKTGRSERAGGERGTEDLGARGRLPPPLFPSALSIEFKCKKR